MAISLLVVAVGCGSAFGERVYTEQTIGGGGSLVESPLPPLTPDEKLLAGPEKVLWGRVVIQGEAAKPGLAEMFLIPAEAVTDDATRAEVDPISKGGQSAQILNKEGLYVFKGIKEGSYKICFRFSRNPIFQNKVTVRYTHPGASPFAIEVLESRTYQDLVVNLDEWSPKK